jgi:hypothetical protein
MSEKIYLLTLCLPLATVLLALAMRVYRRTREAKYRAAADDAYRLLADRSTAAQQETAARLAALQNVIADLQARTASIETILKAVD